MLEEFLGSIGIEQEEFAQLCQSAISEKSQFSVVFHQIMSVEDFPTFKVARNFIFYSGATINRNVLQTMMYKRNAQLNLETIHKVLRGSARLGHK